MNTHHKKQTALADQKDIESNQDFMKPLESISLPVGTFAGIEDRIIRVRNGKRVPADTGDQGGGQNWRMKNQIDHLLAEEILDSRGNPTVQAKVILTNRLGAKAILAVSLAVARAAAAAEQIPLYRYIDQLLDSRKQEFLTLPVPMLNVLNGGRHASNNLAFQEFMLYPTGAMSLAQGLRYAAEIFQQLKSLLYARGFSTAVGDEGGFAPELKNHEERKFSWLVMMSS
jgi:enolase